MSGVGSAQSGLQPRPREAGRPPRPPPPRDRRLQHAAVGGRGPRQPPGGGAGEPQQGDREYHTWESLLLIYLRFIVTTLHHIDIVMLVHKICNNRWQRSLKPPISEDGQTLPTSLQPAACMLRTIITQLLTSCRFYILSISIYQTIQRTCFSRPVPLTASPSPSPSPSRADSL